MPNEDASRWVRPEDLAAVILFLASDEARAVMEVIEAGLTSHAERREISMADD